MTSFWTNGREQLIKATVEERDQVLRELRSQLPTSHEDREKIQSEIKLVKAEYRQRLREIRKGRDLF